MQNIISNPPHQLESFFFYFHCNHHAVQYCSTACGFPYKGPLVVNNNIINEMKFDTCWFAAQVMNPAKIFIIVTTKMVTLACGCNLRNTKVAGICCLLLSYRSPLFIVDILQH